MFFLIIYTNLGISFYFPDKGRGEEVMEDFGTVFKKLRESRHLSLADISKMGVSTSQISLF